MNISLVMTILAEDQPGLVDAISSLVKDHQGNWLESRMSHLGGRFAGILRVELPQARQQSFLQGIENLQTQGWTIVLHPTTPPVQNSLLPEFNLELVGHDRPGIIREISHALALHKVNIKELFTETQSAPMSGDLLFHAKAIIQIPPTCSVQELRILLEKIASDLMVDISLNPGKEEVK
jgi:glycine cleavage system regulatory protein